MRAPFRTPESEAAQRLSASRKGWYESLEETGHGFDLCPLAQSTELARAKRRVVGPFCRVLGPKTNPKQAPVAIINGDGRHGQSDQNGMPIRHAIHGGRPLPIDDVETRNRSQGEGDAHEHEADAKQRGNSEGG